MISRRTILSGCIGAVLAVGVLAVLRLTLLAPAKPSPVVVIPSDRPKPSRTPPEIKHRKPPDTQPAGPEILTDKIVILSPPPQSAVQAATQPAVVSFSRLTSAPAVAPAPVPDTFEAQLAAGKQHLGKGLPQQALKYLQRATAIRPDDPTGLQWLVTALQANDRHAETIPLYKKLIRLHPDDTTARFNLAMALGRQEEYQQAENAYWDLLEIDPDHVETHVNLAILYQHQCKLDTARRHWQKALELQPDSFQAYEGLGEVLTDLGKADEAMEAFAHAAALQPKVASAWLNYAASAVAAGGAGRALIALDRALKLAPYDPEAWSMRGDILLELYRTTKDTQHARQAVLAWKQSLQLQPDQPRLKKKLKTYHSFDTNEGLDK